MPQFARFRCLDFPDFSTGFRPRLFPFAVAALFFALIASSAAFAGGPRYVAGVSYFNPAVKGQPLHWANGQLSYFVDQGPLGPLANSQATAMVDAAAALWSSLPTAAVTLTDQGNLAEDVNGGNIVAGQGVLLQPADVTRDATLTPVAVIYDSDGSVIDALEGISASQPDNCEQNGVLTWIDAMNPDATLGHGVILLNGRCATSPSLLTMMSYQLQRAFGLILGLDLSQVNDGALNLTATEPLATLAWPIMQPVSAECGPGGGTCIPNPGVLRMDDVAALNRLYPVTAGNLASFPGKVLTAANTVSIQGTISFRNGVGMQGVNVVARPLDGNGKPMYADTVTAVSGVYFAGNHGNPVTGWTDANGNRLDRFGSDAASLQGFFDLSGIPLPAGVTMASYQVTFEPVNPLYIDNISVGPYVLGSPSPSGTLPAQKVSGMQAGSATTLSVVSPNSASAMVGDLGGSPGSSLDGGRSIDKQPHVILPAGGSIPVLPVSATGTESNPIPLPRSGQWTSRLGHVNGSDWLMMPVRANRLFTVITQALAENGAPSATKAMPAIGVWDGFAATGSPAVGWAPAANGFAPGETWLQVATLGNDIVRIGVADQRGDGRPDYVYRGWVLYADTVSPARLPSTGGTIVIRGIGFRAGDTVQVGGMPAQVVSILPNEIIAVVAPAPSGTTSSQDVEVDDGPLFNASAVIPGCISYDAASGDALRILSAPQGLAPLNVPQQFSVQAVGVDGKPAAGVTVQYALTGGVATLGCGQSSCAATTGGDGLASLAITATSASVAAVTASLQNGAAVQAQFAGVAPAVLTAVTPTLYIAAGASIAWPVQAMAQISGSPASGQQVTWQSGSGIAAPSSPTTTDGNGMAWATLAVGPLAAGQTATANACLGSSCAALSAFGARPQFATLMGLSGVSQTMAAGTTPAPVVLRVLDMNGHPLAGGTVSVTQSLFSWTPPCPPHGRCAEAHLLARQTTTLTSALDGTISLVPLTLAGVPTSLSGIATTGNTAALSFQVEQHP